MLLLRNGWPWLFASVDSKPKFTLQLRNGWPRFSLLWIPNSCFNSAMASPRFSLLWIPNSCFNSAMAGLGFRFCGFFVRALTPLWPNQCLASVKS